ncbi:enterochelin esterase-like enzyme [Oikeobacillus pervagus]|uniref:Enterochelin esterase-like enzyme n=1 Tax=Oikeobacillus pervagus TaxID=1325931 RepID=A0AAJ1T4A7_9BACI|nr:esterase family protein [Oikeobacillus pervagus]MDQ0215634.1 enterochelin esterase-like enzyme [Oikeobacillus pervagus]
MAIQHGTITDFTIESKELNEEISFLVYLPENFSPLYKYHLLITQDGKDYFQLGRIPRLADEFLAKGEIENVIIVGIPYKNVKDRRKKYHPDGEENKAYIRFIAHELLPFLEEKYPTFQMGKGRALMGDSLGATVSLMTALQYPHTFGKVVLQSPYVDKSVLQAVEQCTELHQLDIYHIIGKGETEVKTTDGKIADFLTPNRELHQLFQKMGKDTFYEEFEGNHTWKFWQPDLKRALKFLIGEK